MSTLSEARSQNRKLETELQYYRSEVSRLATGSALRVDFNRLSQFQQELRSLSSQCASWQSRTENLMARYSRKDNQSDYKQAKALSKAFRQQKSTFSEILGFFQMVEDTSSETEKRAFKQAQALQIAMAGASSGANSGAVSGLRKAVEKAKRAVEGNIADMQAESDSKTVNSNVKWFLEALSNFIESQVIEYIKSLSDQELRELIQSGELSEKHLRLLVEHVSGVQFNRLLKTLSYEDRAALIAVASGLRLEKLYDTFTDEQLEEIKYSSPELFCLITSRTVIHENLDGRFVDDDILASTYSHLGLEEVTDPVQMLAWLQTLQVMTDEEVAAAIANGDYEAIGIARDYVLGEEYEAYLEGNLELVYSLPGQHPTGGMGTQWENYQDYDSLADIPYDERGYQRETNANYVHTGTDIALPNGSDVFATTAGYVSGTRSGIEHGGASEGNYVLVTDKNDNVHHYAHLSQPTVEEDKLVLPGEKIGESGNSGNGGYHLHYEVQDPDGWWGNAPTRVNPYTFYE